MSTTESAVTVVDPLLAAPLRAARYRPPAVARSDLQRERLLRLLADDPMPVTLVCAPAGSGKTSLLASACGVTTVGRRGSRRSG